MPVSVTTKTTVRSSKTEILLGKRASICIGLGLAFAALAIFWIGHWTDIDLQLADAMYDQASTSFPWRDSWLADTFNHQILKVVMTILGATVIAAAVTDAIWPQRHFNHAGRRVRLRIIACSAALVPLVISLLKQRSNSHCPWDLARYGGTEPYLRLFDALPVGVPPGHCLPAGHASSSLWLVAIAVWWLPAAPRKAVTVMGGTLALGLAVGWLQQLRGAHFLTHTLWSAWIACTIVFFLVLVLQRRAASRVHVETSSESLPS
jgi:membrane-associated PAP2 superfamily phosphatase